ncbi:helix-turn-helix transcriptional regulator [Hominenteromicrobium sp.]|uniref:helix-turn-helix transcriptional regulator n=1 Tax=Hominenteromicrobium sp. TaxID=3073581 RepID=UPI003A908F09
MNNRIEEERKRRGMTQQQLAGELGVSRQTIISLESGRYNPSILLAHRIARLFDAKIEDIFLFDTEEEA